MCPPSPSLTVPQPSTLRLTPLLCKEGRGEVECRRLYPTQPPLTKGRRQLRVRVSSPFMNNPGYRNSTEQFMVDKDSVSIAVSY